jgi:PIN domain nuclease of toxin-antitoxin system
MILLDTHIWIWLVNESPRLRSSWAKMLERTPSSEMAISIITCREVAKLVEKRKFEITVPVRQWLKEALDYTGVTVLPLTVEVIADCTNLPDSFHRDPIDQIIVSTARVHGYTLMTEDRKILSYPYVNTFLTD